MINFQLLSVLWILEVSLKTIMLLFNSDSLVI